MLLSSFLPAKQNPSIPTKKNEFNFKKYLKYSRHCKFSHKFTLVETHDIFKKIKDKNSKSDTFAKISWNSYEPTKAQDLNTINTKLYFSVPLHV